MRFASVDAPDYSNLLACIRCGLCLSVCPTYHTDHLETQSPRGRVALIRAADEGRLPVGSPTFRDHLYHCLDCRACQTICPSGVRVGELVLAARAEVESERRPGWAERLIRLVVLRTLFIAPPWLERGAALLRLYQRLGVQSFVRKIGVLNKLPGRLKTLAVLDALLPPLPARPLRQELAEVTPARGERRYRVGFFLGCVMSVVFAEASRSTVDVLTENDCEVVTPKGQRCCGAPHAGEGDMATLRALARHNVDLFLGHRLDYIVTDCAACSAQTKEYAHLLGLEPAYAAKARAFSAKVRDISELLTEIPLKQPAGEVRARVTYHEACHLCHAQGVRTPPREIIRRVPGVELVEMRESDWCCGSAGVYNVTHRERARKLLGRKLANAGATGAEVIVTGNPGCLLYLQAGVREQRLNARVLHLTQLLDAAYRSSRHGDAGRR
ncbi:MAG: (Fe-S)-binding protein [Chloroflexi bacterium]|nr:(Fe-S)-binding protein [Chloroflexota bacterium]